MLSYINLFQGYYLNKLTYFTEIYQKYHVLCIYKIYEEKKSIFSYISYIYIQYDNLTKNLLYILIYKHNFFFQNQKQY